ncbi:ATP synthase F1 subunit delta [Flavobacterium sp. RHBU_3]|uniref:ATP synthase F1 subunit delta n=1 Tax=Flavobacterium sp. RHBU_3 TaxID=3391184 RepID=UPI003985280A
MSRAAVRYAKAILDLAQTQGNAATVAADMAQITAAVQESKELQNFLNTPNVKGEVKFSALKEIFAGAQNVTESLFQLLAENKRFEILPAIAAQYKEQYDAASGIETAVVTTAFPIDADLEAKVLAKVKQFTPNQVTLKNVVDPSIIGGFIIRLGDKQYNASIAARLLTLKRELAN